MKKISIKIIGVIAESPALNVYEIDSTKDLKLNDLLTTEDDLEKVAFENTFFLKDILGVSTIVVDKPIPLSQNRLLYVFYRESVSQEVRKEEIKIREEIRQQYLDTKFTGKIEDRLIEECLYIISDTDLSLNGIDPNFSKGIITKTTKKGILSYIEAQKKGFNKTEEEISKCIWKEVVINKFTIFINIVLEKTTKNALEETNSISETNSSEKNTFHIKKETTN